MSIGVDYAIAQEDGVPIYGGKDKHFGRHLIRFLLLLKLGGGEKPDGAISARTDLHIYRVGVPIEGLERVGDEIDRAVIGGKAIPLSLMTISGTLTSINASSAIDAL